MRRLLAATLLFVLAGCGAVAQSLPATPALTAVHSAAQAESVIKSAGLSGKNSITFVFGNFSSRTVFGHVVNSGSCWEPYEAVDPLSPRSREFLTLLYDGRCGANPPPFIVSWSNALPAFSGGCSYSVGYANGGSGVMGNFTVQESDTTLKCLNRAYMNPGHYVFYKANIKDT